MTPERKRKFLSVLDKRQNDITVVLENVFDPHNISAVMRTCDAVGIQDVYVLNTKIPKHQKWGAKSSSSAVNWITVHQLSSSEECISLLRKNYSRILTTYISGESLSLHDVDFTESVALIFGNEHDGVSEEIRNMTDGNFVIPQVGMIQSLNISVACAVTLYEAFRQKNNAGHYSQQKLSNVRHNELFTQWSFLNKQ